MFELERSKNARRERVKSEGSESLVVVLTRYGEAIVMVGDWCDSGM